MPEWSVIHGKYKTPEYAAWQDMKGRCLRPSHQSYPHYGGRGITIDPRWLDFLTFFADMGERPSSQHSLDREDNDGPYTKTNCRWATRWEQMRNQRKTVLLTHNGETLHLSAWARRLGVKTSTLIHRRKMEWPLEEVLQPSTKPPLALTTDQRTAIRADPRAQWQIATSYGVSQMTVSRIKRKVRGHT